MKKVYIKNVGFQDVIIASTSQPDYDMSRIYLFDTYVDFEFEGEFPDRNKHEYIVGRGGHCSCYGFDETEWDFIAYTEDEIRTLAEANERYHDYEGAFWKLVLEYIGRLKR